eukprot:478985_1
MSHISSQMSKIIACYTILVHYLVLGDFNTTRISFGSCSFPHKDTSIFNIMSQRNPDIFIWTGDATYLDYENYDPSSAMDTITVAVNGGIDPAPIDTWEKTWNIMNADANYKQFIDTLPVLTGVWDDHEYGLNDANGLNNFKNKDYAQTLYLNFLNVSQNDSKRFQKGLYEHIEFTIDLNFESSQKTKIIDIILLDTRYFSQINGKGNILGEIQWNWLENIIKNKISNDNELTMIISSTQFAPVSRSGRETWGINYKESQKRLYKLLIEHNKSKRVILISGDIHQGSIMKTTCLNKANPNQRQNIFEICSSGLTHANHYNEDYLLRIDEMKADYTWFDGVEQCVYTGRNFGEIEIEWKWNQNISDFEIKNIDGLIFNIDGDKECELDIPLWNDNNNNINYDENGYYLTDLDDYRCYGGIKQFSQADVDSQSFKQIMFIIVIYGG